MRFNLSLAQLFLGITAWAIFLAAFLGWFPNWVYAALSLAVVVAVVMLMVRRNSIGAVSWVALPLVCLLNWSLFYIAMGYVFGERDPVARGLGPLASYISLPVVWFQNSVPLGRPWDTLIGLAVVSLLETAALVVGTIVVSRRWLKLPHSEPVKPLENPHDS